MKTYTQSMQRLGKKKIFIIEEFLLVTFSPSQVVFGKAEFAIQARARSWEQKSNSGSERPFGIRAAVQDQCIYYASVDQCNWSRPGAGLYIDPTRINAVIPL
jgi:hypothetical protein